MYFEEAYFQGEERDGFFVEEMMKRAWAAQIEVLKEIEQVCTRHGLRYYAGYGTLLGAVRHHGFIPWDDDMDIFMLRDDYEQFLPFFQKEMPKGYALLNNYLDERFDEVFSRVVNGMEINLTEAYLKRYHGCPYVVGVDIFPLDFLSRDEADVKLQYELYRLVMGTKNQLMASTDNEEELLGTVEELCGVTIDRNAPVKRQLLRLMDRISSLYHREESDEVAIMHSNVNGFTGRMEKGWFEETVWLPFECTEIPVPANYHACLNRIYGDSYMTPIRFAAHNYPFYKQQEEILREMRGQP